VPLTAPDGVSARAIARLEGKPVEVLGERSETGSVFALPDGTMAVGMGSGPVWVRTGGDGTAAADWAAVDLTLVQGDDGSIRPVAQSANLTLSGGSTPAADATAPTPTPTPTPTVVPTQAVETVDGDSSAAVAPAATPVELASLSDPASGVTTRVQWHGELPEPELTGRRATYRDVRPGIDLVMEATSTGYEQFFVLHDRPAVGASLELPITVTTEGGTVQASDGGALDVVSDGKVVTSAGTPLMWDADSDQGRAFPVTEDRPDEVPGGLGLSPMPDWVAGPATAGGPSVDGAPVPSVGEPRVDPYAEAVQVQRTVDQAAPDSAVVTLAPQDDFLQDPDTTYPVVVDPDMRIYTGFDTSVVQGYSDDRSGRAELEVGTYDGGAHIGRAFLTFNVSPLWGKTIYNAGIDLYNYNSWSCQARNWEIWSTAPSGPGTTWANQPAWYQKWNSTSETHGYTGCGEAWSSTNISALAAAWAGDSRFAEGYVGIKAENESDNFSHKYFASADTGVVPSIWATYNSVPNPPANLQVSASSTTPASGTWTQTTTPKLSASISDPDPGQSINGKFEVFDSSLHLIYTQDANFLPNPTAASIQVPSGVLTNGSRYYFHARVSDNIIDGPYSAWFEFGVDTDAPVAPDVSSAKYPSDGNWHGDAGQVGTFDFGPHVADGTITAYRWGLDKAPDPAQQVVTTPGAAGWVQVTPTEAGRHVLQVQTVDRAGNVSGIASYVFRVGQAGIISPEDATKVVRRVRIGVEAMPGLDFVHFQWRRGPDSPDSEIQDVPTTLLASSAGTTWTAAWQALPTGPVKTTGYTTWDVGAMLGYLGGPVQVRAQVSATASASGAKNTQWVTVVVDPDADGAATSAIGPGAVNLLTGDHALTVTDAEEFGLSMIRTTSSRDTDSGYQLQADRLTKDQHEANTLTGTAGSASVTLDSVRHHDGATSYKLTPANGYTDTYVGLGGDVGAMRLGMQAGRSYRISGWILVPTATGLSPVHTNGLTMALYTRVGTGSYNDPAVTGTRTARPAITGAWQQVSMDVTIPAGATEAFLRLYNGFSDTSKVVYFDDISINELWSPFGPQWSTGTADAASGTAYTRITRPYDDVVALELTGGGQVWFTSGGGRWWPEPGAESLTLTATSPTSWRVTEVDGTVSDFQQNTASGDFPVLASSPPGAAGAVRHVYDLGAVPGVSRLSRIIAPIEPGVDGWPTNTAACTTAIPARGCEVMDLEYATATTATSTKAGNYTGRVANISVWTPDTGTSMVKAQVASYAYDTTGRLTEVHDPRIVAAGAPKLVTAYAYDTAGRLTSVTAPGDLPYTYAYGAGGTKTTGAGDWIDPAPGRLLTVTRASLVPGTAGTKGPDNTTTVVYGVPLTRDAGGPYDLNSTTIATWAQIDGPTDATAIFGPLDVPAVTSATATSPGKDGYGRATVSYLNASGLEVNTAAPAAKNAPVEGFIDTTEYDLRGNVVRTLDATNRLLALKKLPNAASMLAAWSLDGKTSLELSQLLDSRSEYSEDGLDQLTALGPVQHLVFVDDDPTTVDGGMRNLRPLTTNVYDQGKPDGATYHLLTSTTTSGLDPVTGQTYDPLTTTNTYTPVDGAYALGSTSGWVHKQPTAVTVDAGQPGALTSSVVYDTRGRAIRSSKPGSTGADAGTTVAVFYTAGPNPDDAACANKPEWAGQPCLTKAAGPVTAPAGSPLWPDLPIKRVEAYNGFGSPTVVSDTAGSGTGLVKRTTTTQYDAADRVTSVSLTGTGTGVGAAIATTKTTYSATTGDVTDNISEDGTSPAQKVHKEYDQLGRLIKYTDATGAWTATTYDRLGQPSTVTDSIGTTRTYEYDRDVEPRGFVTKMTDSVAGTITPTWGPDGQLESQTLPGGVRLTITYDTARVPVARTYTRIDNGGVIASDRVEENQRGQWITHTSDTGVRTYTYDRLGRLTGVDDTPTGAKCTSRRYGFDTHTNRTSKSTATATAGTTCPGTTGATTTVSTYDSADRLLSTSGANGSAWAYDKLGRITAMPTADGAAVATTGYYVNDLVATQEVPGAKRSTWTLDPLQRFDKQSTSTWVNGAWGTATVSLNHYDGDSDEPSWIAEDLTQPNKISRYVEGMDGAVAMQTGKTGQRVLQLVDLHGDITATLPIADGASTATTTVQFTSFDEFGVPQAMTTGQTGTSSPGRYGWLGASQRSADTPSGAILMGVRLYAPWLGRLLSVDSLPGGSANPYAYPADPVNAVDLDGKAWNWRTVAKVAAVVGGIAGAAACGATVVCAVAVGAAAGFATYAASNAGTPNWSWRRAAVSTVVGGVSGGAVRAAGLLAANSSRLGLSSARFGNYSLGKIAKPGGTLNNKFRTLKIGWGVRNPSRIPFVRPKYSQTFRIGWTSKGVRRHIDLLAGWRLP